MNRDSLEKCKVAAAYILKRLRDEGLTLEQAKELFPFMKKTTDEFDRQSKIGARRNDEEVRRKQRMDRRRSRRDSGEGHGLEGD